MNGYCRNDLNCPFAHGAIDMHGMVVASTAPMQPMQPIVAINPPKPVKPDYGQAG